MPLRSSIVSLLALVQVAMFAAACASTAPCTKDGATVANTQSGDVGATGSDANAAPVAGEPDIVELAKKVLACKNTHDCKEPADWSWTAETWEGGAGDAALVSLVRDPDPNMRALVAGQLESIYFGKKVPTRRRGYPSNAELGTRIIEAFAVEQNESAASALGTAMACINFNSTHLVDKAWSAFRASKISRGRTAFLRALGRNYGSDAKIIERIEGATTDGDGDVRIDALGALDAGGDPSPAVCDFWQKSLAATDAQFVGKAVSLLTENKCANVGKALDVLEKNATLASYSLESVCGREDVSAADKARAGKIAKARAMNGKAQVFDRSNALQAYMKCDADEGKKLATTLTNDPDKEMQESAKSLLSGS